MIKIFTLLITNTEYKLVMDNVSYSGEKLDELLAVLDDKGITFEDFNEVITTDELRVLLYIKKPDIKSVSTEVTQNLFTGESIYRTVTEFFDNSVLMKEYKTLDDMETALKNDLKE